MTRKTLIIDAYNDGIKDCFNKIESFMRKVKKEVYTGNGRHWITVMELSVYPKDWKEIKEHMKIPRNNKFIKVTSK